MIRHLAIAVLFLGAAASAAAQPVPSPSSLTTTAEWTGPMAKLARIDASLITRTGSHRPDAPSCQVKNGKTLVRALYSCLPLLEIYQAAEPLRADIMTWGLLRDPQSAESRKFDQDWEQFQQLAASRDYPAGDVALVQVHLTRSNLFLSRGNYCRARAEIEAAIAVIASSRIAEPVFDIRASLRKRLAALPGAD